MMRLSVSVPFCVHLLSMHMRDIRDSVKHLCHSPNLPDIVTGRAWRWRSDGGLARYRGTRSAVLQTAETELSRARRNGWRRLVLTRRRAQARMRGQSAFFLSTTFEPTLAHSMNTRTGPKITSSTMPKAGSTLASVSSSGSCPS